MKRIQCGNRISQAVIHGGMVYTAGQTDDSGPDVTTQTAAVLAKIDALLLEAGTDKGELISANIWLADIADFDRMNAVWEAWIAPGAAPARATVQSTLCAPEFIVEIMVTAALK